MPSSAPLLLPLLLLLLSAAMLIFAVAVEATDWKCDHVNQGKFYASGINIPRLSAEKLLRTKVRLARDTAQYIFTPSNPKGQLCQNSWNKLWGKSRCGYFNAHHKDSDRFVWRRSLECLLFDSKGHVTGQKTDCDQKDLIEVAAYAYDDSKKPFEHQGTLLKIFSTRLRVEKDYALELEFLPTQTIYRIFDADSESLLETLQIVHRDCGNKAHRGYSLGLYFGGQCEAPSRVSACYNRL